MKNFKEGDIFEGRDAVVVGVGFGLVLGVASIVGIRAGQEYRGIPPAEKPAITTRYFPEESFIINYQNPELLRRRREQEEEFRKEREITRVRIIAMGGFARD